jgi:hypothetical protein
LKRFSWDKRICELSHPDGWELPAAEVKRSKKAKMPLDAELNTFIKAIIFMVI